MKSIDKIAIQQSNTLSYVHYIAMDAEEFIEHKECEARVEDEPSHDGAKIQLEALWEPVHTHVIVRIRRITATTNKRRLSSTPASPANPKNFHNWVTRSRQVSSSCTPS